MGMSEDVKEWNAMVWRIDQLTAQLAERDAEIARLKSMSVCEACVEIPSVMEYFSQVETQLAAQQLENQRLREALENFICSHQECTDFDGFTAQIVSMDDYHEAQEALSTPASTEHLEAYVLSMFVEEGKVIEGYEDRIVHWRDGFIPSIETKLYRLKEAK